MPLCPGYETPTFELHSLLNKLQMELRKKIFSAYRSKPHGLTLVTLFYFFMLRLCGKAAQTSNYPIRRFTPVFFYKGTALKRPPFQAAFAFLS
jgi:hypothetical protein